MTGKRFIWFGTLAVAVILAAALYVPIRASVVSSQTPSPASVETNGKPLDPELPPAVNDPTADARKTVAAAGLRNYRETLPEWEGDFVVRERITPAFKEWLKRKVKIDQLQDDKVVRVHAARKEGQWRYDEFGTGKDGKEWVYSTTWDGNRHVSFIKNDSGDHAVIESSPKSRKFEEFNEIDKLLIASVLDRFDLSLAYYAGTTKLEDGDMECYVQTNNKGWLAVWLDPARGYGPVRVLGGLHAPWTLFRYEYSDWRQDESGRWMPGKVVTNMRITETGEPAKTIEVTVGDFSRKISPDAFQGYKLPKGTQVSDRIKNKQYVVDEAS